MPTTSDANHNEPSRSYPTPPLPIVITITILIFLFIGFFLIYFCRYLLQNVLYSWHRNNNGSTGAVGPGPAISSPNPGLDSAIVARFPTFKYSTIKEYRRERYGLECAICLVEFQDEHMLRLIRLCAHVFHQECIDLWFEMHKTCPVCRRNLDVLTKSVENTPGRSPFNEEGAVGSVAITIKEDEEEKNGEKYEAFGEKGATCIQNEEHQQKSEIIGRSNTTGHSLFLSRDDEDKFTLRLPDHVTEKLIKGNHWPKTLYSSGELKGKMNFFGEGSGGDVNNV